MPSKRQKCLAQEKNAEVYLKCWAQAKNAELKPKMPSLGKMPNLYKLKW